MSVCSLLYGHYEQLVDRESAYEILKARAATSPEQAPVEADRGFNWGELLGGTIGSQLGRQVIRGVLGSIFGGGRRR